jgi:hypothetical protein
MGIAPLYSLLTFYLVVVECRDLPNPERGNMDALLHQPGFFGTRANFAADMTLLISILVAMLFTYGVQLACQEKFQTHR